MTLIDANAYLGEWPFRRLRHRGVEGLLALMDRGGIEKALVSSLEAAFRQDVTRCNEELAAQVAGAGGRLAALAAVNPAYPEWRAEVEGAAGLAGIRLYPNYHGYDPVDAEAAAGAASERGFAAFVALRLQDERQHHPACKVAAVAVEAVAALARRVPGARIVATMARFGEARALLECPNLYVEVSGIQGPTGCIERLVEQYGSERLLFGSGIPLQYPLPGVMKLGMARIAEAQREMIASGNAALLTGGGGVNR